MTIRAMLSLLAIGATGLTFAACGSPETPSASQTEELQAAEDQAAEATERVEDLTQTVAELEQDLARDFDRFAERSGKRTKQFATRLDSISERLKGGLGDLRAAIEAAESSSAAASSDAAAALGEVQGVAQDLSILRTRYDEHLRRFHGGG